MKQKSSSLSLRELRDFKRQEEGGNASLLVNAFAALRRMSGISLSFIVVSINLRENKRFNEILIPFLVGLKREEECICHCSLSRTLYPRLACPIQIHFQMRRLHFIVKGPCGWAWLSLVMKSSAFPAIGRELIAGIIRKMFPLVERGREDFQTLQGPRVFPIFFCSSSVPCLACACNVCSYAEHTRMHTWM